MMVLLIISTAILIVIAYQDFHFRAVSWLLLPALFTVLAGRETVESGWEEWLMNWGYNNVLLLVQWALLSIYFSLKAKRWVNIFNTLFGLGDGLFLVAVGAAFTPVEFVAFMVVGVLTGIGFYIVLHLLRNPVKTIPLAGIMALLLIGTLLLRLIDFSISSIPITSLMP